MATAKVINIGDHSHERNNVIPPEARAEEIDWPSVPDVELGKTITDTYTSFQLLTRRAQKELREQLLPALREVRRRFKEGQQVGGFKTIKAYFSSIGIDPAKVRVWEQRDREQLMEEIVEQQEREWEAKRTASPVTDDQEEDEEYDVSHEEAAAQYKQWKANFDANFKFNSNRAHNSFRPPANRPSPEMLKMAETFVSTAKKSLAHLHHPDKGGSNEKMQLVNDTAAWMLGFVKAASRTHGR